MENKDFAERLNARYAAIGDKGQRNERVMWPDMQKQYHRFSELVHFIGDLGSEDISILDVGCGNGELLRYLNFRGFKGDYVGIDLNESLLDEARRLYPRAQFLSVDQYERCENRSCSYALMSGIFNLAVGQDNAFVHGVIGKYFSTVEKALIFNAVSSYVNFIDERMFYFDLAEITDFAAKNLSSTFEIRHGFLPYNFSMCIWKGRPWRSLTDAPPAR